MDMTWRELLGTILMDPQEQQRIQDALSVNAMTLRRWITGETNPRPQNLRLLLNALPQYRKQMIDLLAKEFPPAGTTNVLKEEEIFQISADFYGCVISSYVNVSRHLRSSTISNLILQQMLRHLDAGRAGMLVSVAQCVPPSVGQVVRSLRIVAGRGSAPWGNNIESHPQFLGIESMVGYVVSSGHMTAVQNQAEILRNFPGDYIDGLESAVAVPIVLANRIVGGLYVASAEASYFSSSLIICIQKYAELLCLSFDENEYYLFRDVALGVMPAREKQFPSLLTFQQRVTQQIMLAAHQKHTTTRIEAEKIIWQQLEKELFAITTASSSHPPVSILAP
ncbi:hypothetical protein [Dictyobacter arantiisoli]|uniref:GAF domain-containing protein n=1 Tax=Dictyobacter arantiisoli TaxID=2014874 RepID=A0A5A5T541_9CHLR|nr:hypothetical protein [Dictyobacter arantiisoli]GCF06461.1 hypothetical protein KDI_00250 [Dictyobacter arantiisoli]